MAAGKKMNGISRSTPARPGGGPARQSRGRPAAAEPYKKVTVCLFNRHTLFLDKLALAIQERTGQHIPRAELIRAMVNHAAAWIDPNREDFNTTLRSLLPNLKGGDKPQ